MSRNRPNLVITGFMGTGKTTVGKEVALRLEKEFYDLDQMIEERMKLSIPEIFEKYGESYFRDMESKIVSEYSVKSDSVIATGGGTLIFNHNYSWVSENGIIFCLKAEKTIVIKRLENSFARPLLSGQILGDRIDALLKERKELYEKLPNQIDTSFLSAWEVATRIIELYNHKIFHVDKK